VFTVTPLAAIVVAPATVSVPLRVALLSWLRLFTFPESFQDRNKYECAELQCYEQSSDEQYLIPDSASSLANQEYYAQ
jgi:hypothetical protein